MSLKTSYRPDWFNFSNKEGADIIPDLSLIPTWGIRRNLGKHWNYEVGIGLGYRVEFDQHTTSQISGSTAIDIHLRIGYRF